MFSAHAELMRTSGPTTLVETTGWVPFMDTWSALVTEAGSTSASKRRTTVTEVSTSDAPWAGFDHRSVMVVTAAVGTGAGGCCAEAWRAEPPPPPPQPETAEARPARTRSEETEVAALGWTSMRGHPWCVGDPLAGRPQQTSGRA